VAVPADPPGAEVGHETDRPGRPPTGLTIGLLLAVSVGALESLTVLSVMPQVARELNGLDLYGWVFAGFFVSSALAIPVAARVIDASGLRWPFAVGLALFGGGLLAAGFAPSMAVLVAARVLQGTGAGTLSAVTYASIAVAYAPRDRARILALFSSAWLVPSFIGPVLGGLIATVAGWRWTFLALAAVVPVVAVLVLPAVSGHDRRRRVADPASSGGPWLLPPAPIRRAASISLLGNLALYGAFAFAPVAMTDLRGQSVLDAGIAIAILSVSWVAAAWAHQRVADRFQFRDSIRAGFLAMTVALAAACTLVAPEVPFGLILVAWVIVGIGAGVAFQAVNLFVFAQAQPGAEGRATSSVQLAITIGAAIGTSAMGSLLNLGRGAGLGLEGALAVVFATCVALMAIATVIAWGLPRLAAPLRTPGREDAVGDPQRRPAVDRDNADVGLAAVVEGGQNDRVAAG
jgi:MFS family permease